MLDKVKVRQKISFIEQNISLLRELKELPFDEFKKEKYSIPASIRCLQISIEAMIDIASHIVARLRLGMPGNYSESFKLLEQHNIIPADFLPTLLQMVKFRNRAVHLYDNVDDDEVYKIIKNNLSDFERFIGIIVERFF